MKLPEFPQEIKRGSISVTVYVTPTKGYSAYTLSYYQDGQRKREMSTDYPAIRKRADEVLDDLSAGRTPETGAIKASERDEFLRAKMTIAKVSHIVKAPLPLDLVARHYAQAVRILGNDLVIEAAREYARRHPVKLPPIKIADLVTDFLAEKKKQERSDRHLETLKSHCTRFGAKPCSMMCRAGTLNGIRPNCSAFLCAGRLRHHLQEFGGLPCLSHYVQDCRAHIREGHRDFLRQ